MNQEDKAEKVFKVDSARVTNVKLVEAKVKPSVIHERLAKLPIGSTKVNAAESDLKNEVEIKTKSTLSNIRN
jgi:hypothetical protein